MTTDNNSSDAVHREWEIVISVAQHFNDLLMRLRAFGLPLLGTIAGAGLALGLNNSFARIPDWACAVFVGVNVVAVVFLVPFMLYGRKWVDDKKVEITTTEQVMWWSVPLLAVAMAIGFSYLCLSDTIDLTEHHTLNAGPLILFFALAVLIVLYIVDRFYYYKLLMGAVNRATTLEKKLGYEMTTTITEYIRPQEAASIITLLYFLPGVTGYVALMILVGFNPLITK